MASLKVRFLLVAALVLALFSISAGFILRQSFEASIRDRAQEQLKLQLYGLLAAAEFEATGMDLPLNLSEPRFNQLQSGLFAAVYTKRNRLWQSQSFVEAAVGVPYLPPAGKWLFSEVQTQWGRYYRVSFTVLWELQGDGEAPFTFVIWESDEPYLAQIRSFEKTLWIWLGGLVVAAICVVFAGLQLGFRPFARLAKELQEVEQAQSEQIAGSYPTEINQVVNNLNQLIVHERGMRERYKNSLGDLAHSLKTPLTILKGMQLQSNTEPQHELLQQQVSRMDEIVNYQLTRAISLVPNLSAHGVLLIDIYHKLTSVLLKVYGDSELQFEHDIRPGLRLPWDEGDALEVLGNLMDNACKYGAGWVRVSCWIEAGHICITVEDNGAGIPSGDVSLVLSRGGRRDELAAGQGIGLAVVTDIVEASNGSVSIEKSDHGGAKFKLSLALF